MLCSGHWDPLHHYLEQIVPRVKVFLSLTLSCLRLPDGYVLHLTDAFDNLHTPSMALNAVTDIDQDVLLRLASNVVTLDLEANKMDFALHSLAYERL